MKSLNRAGSSVSCLLCDRVLLRHLRGAQIYWWCLNCRQEIPVLEAHASPLPTFLAQPETMPEKVLVTAT